MKFFFSLLLILISIKAFAHQPKLVKYSPSKENPYKVIYPEISKAYYGKLSGEAHYYIISSEKDFLFYTGILSPKIDESYKWLSLDILDKNNNIIYQADGSQHNWNAWYEPYARDWYWKGPEIGGEINQETGFKKSFLIEAGTYKIKVYNNDNLGNYSLAVGEAEFFGSNTFEKILTWTPIIFYIGPYMDIVHWKKFDVAAYIPHIMLLVLFFLFYIIIKKIFFKKKIMLNKKLIIFLTFLLIYPLPALAHNFIGKIGFYDGMSHPVLGLDHFLAMISVGIVSAQIGGKAIWTVPTTFVSIMTIGGLFGFLLIIEEFYFVEIGIILSVILLGFGISIEKKIPTKLIMVFVGIFGLFHGTAHGLEVPAAANPILFVLGFICGTSALHLFGVAIGYFSIKTAISSILLRLTGIIFAIYGIYLMYLAF